MFLREAINQIPTKNFEKKIEFNLIYINKCIEINQEIILENILSGKNFLKLKSKKIRNYSIV